MSPPIPSSPLILGGHSYIAQLGNDPKPTADRIDAIVSTCLDSGIDLFDTTYRPERLALGAVLARLARRDEARIIVWNFFDIFSDDEPCGGPRPYREADLDALQADLQTDFLDELVVHRVGDAAADRAQEALAARWKSSGRVRRLGLWAPGVSSPSDTVYDFVVEPYNLFTEGASERFAAYARHGWEIYACSPFVRGWQVERLAALAATELQVDAVTARARVADHLLRYALFAPHIGRLIVAMRRPEWVQANLASVQRGPLTHTEQSWLASVFGKV